MITYTKNNLDRAVLTLEEEEDIGEDYQMPMLQKNKIPGFLDTDIILIDDKRYYRYDISGKVSLKSKYEKSKLKGGDMKKLIYAILKAIKDAANFMLDAKGIMLDPEHIFCEDGRFFFCYCPTKERELTDEFHKLTEYFVREVDYRDQDGIHLAYMFHKSTMEENYSIEKIMDRAEEEIAKKDGASEAEIATNRASVNMAVGESLRDVNPVYGPATPYGISVSGSSVSKPNDIGIKTGFWEPVKRWMDKHRKSVSLK